MIKLLYIVLGAAALLSGSAWFATSTAQGPNNPNPGAGNIAPIRPDVTRPGGGMPGTPREVAPAERFGAADKPKTKNAKRQERRPE